MKILFICLGNICRSPLAEGIFKEKVQRRGLEDKIVMDSCGTSAYHLGERPDKRAQATAESHGVVLNHHARQYQAGDYLHFDYLLAMDQSNFEDVLATLHVDGPSKVFKMRDFETSADLKSLDVPDPYFGGDEGFEEVFQILDRTTENLLDFLVAQHDLK